MYACTTEVIMSCPVSCSLGGGGGKLPDAESESVVRSLRKAVFFPSHLHVCVFSFFCFFYGPLIEFVFSRVLLSATLRFSCYHGASHPFSRHPTFP